MAEQRSSIFDVATGWWMRKSLRGIMTWGLDRAHTRAPKTFNSLAWMHLKPEGKKSKQWFTTGVLLVGTWLDWLASHSSAPPNQVKEVVETTFQDLPGTFEDYFKLHEREINLPPDFEGPKTEQDVKALIREFQSFIGAEMGTNLPGLLDNFKLNPWASHAERFFKTLTASNRILAWFFLKYLDDLPEEEKENFLKSIEYFDTPGELEFFMDQGPEGRRMILDWATRLHDLSLVPTLTRLYRDNYPKFVREYNQFVGMLADGIRSTADSVELSNAKRKVVIAKRRAEYVAPKYSWFPTWARWVVGCCLGVVLVSLLTAKGCEWSENSRRERDAKQNAIRVTQDSIKVLNHERESWRERYIQLADWVAQHPSDAAPDPASNRR